MSADSAGEALVAHLAFVRASSSLDPGCVCELVTVSERGNHHVKALNNIDALCLVRDLALFLSRDISAREMNKLFSEKLD